MTEEKATVNINIHGGNNQILPNATHAEQHFHYHATAAAEPPLRTRIYNNVEIDSDSIDEDRQCCTAVRYGNLCTNNRYIKVLLHI